MRRPLPKSGVLKVTYEVSIRAGFSLLLVGGGSRDVLATDGNRRRPVIIENPLKATELEPERVKLE